MTYRNSDIETTTLSLIKRTFVLYAENNSYEITVNKVSEIFGNSWEKYKNEVMQWYDFEILKVKGE